MSALDSNTPRSKNADDIDNVNTASSGENKTSFPEYKSAKLGIRKGKYYNRKQLRLASYTQAP